MSLFSFKLLNLTLGGITISSYFNFSSPLSGLECVIGCFSNVCSSPFTYKSAFKNRFLKSSLVLFTISKNLTELLLYFTVKIPKIFRNLKLISKIKPQ